MTFKTLVFFLCFISISAASKASEVRSVQSDYPPVTQELWEIFEKPASEQFETDAILMFHTLISPESLLKF